ncbi:MAG: NYN domain-containing protein, partial [Eggerthellaceae bacterium]|nr:NYN domain-containing protein [Eggerthellaceae bacterium]
YTGSVDGFCIVSSDSDFTRLASRLRESGLMVIGMGEKKTPTPFRTACDIFTTLELLVVQNHKNVRSSSSPTMSKEEIEQAVVDIIEDNQNNGKTTGLGEVGSRLLKRFPDFDVRSYGTNLLSKLLEEFSRVTITKDRSSVTVELTENAQPPQKAKASETSRPETEETESREIQKRPASQNALASVPQSAQGKPTQHDKNPSAPKTDDEGLRRTRRNRNGHRVSSKGAEAEERTSEDLGEAIAEAVTESAKDALELAADITLAAEEQSPDEPEKETGAKPVNEANGAARHPSRNHRQRRREQDEHEKPSSSEELIKIEVQPEPASDEGIASPQDASADENETADVMQQTVAAQEETESASKDNRKFKGQRRQRNRSGKPYQPKPEDEGNDSPETPHIPAEQLINTPKLEGNTEANALSQAPESAKPESDYNRAGHVTPSPFKGSSSHEDRGRENSELPQYMQAPESRPSGKESETAVPSERSDTENDEHHGRPVVYSVVSPDSSERAQQETEAPESEPKKRRGRPKGSKNKTSQKFYPPEDTTGKRGRKP